MQTESKISIGQFESIVCDFHLPIETLLSMQLILIIHVKAEECGIPYKTNLS